MNIKEVVEQNKDFLVSARRHIHQHPELGSQEFETNKYFRKYLDEWKIPYTQAGKTSIVAVIKGEKNTGKKGKVIATRGDIDALPIEEQTGLSFSSKTKGVMHACGHDFHGTYQLGLAKILNEHKSEINGTVKIIFQEGEEIGAGAQEIVDAGLLDDVDNVIGLHVSSGDEVNTFSLNYGIMSAGGGGQTITITSDSNALIPAGELITSVSGILNRAHNKQKQAVAVPTVVKVLEKKKGIPSKVEIQVNFRTYESDVVAKLHSIFDLIAKGIETTYFAKIEIKHVSFTHVINNDKASTDRAAKVLEKNFGKKSVIWAEPSTGGENFSVFQEKIPGVFIHVGAAPKNHPKGEFIPHHSPNVVFDEDALVLGVEVFLYYIFDFLDS